MTSYLIFANEQLKKYAAATGNKFDVKDVTRKSGELWRGMSEVEKQVSVRQLSS